MPGEFGFLSNLKKRFNLSKIGDDCAVLSAGGGVDLVVTSDMLVENVDFRSDWITPESLGHRALAISLSDIAAMGAEPRWGFVSAAFRVEEWEDSFADDFFAGYTALAGEFGVELSGGDISRTSGDISVDSTVIGTVESGTAIMRSGAKAGDLIYVTGGLGGAAGGLRILENSLSAGEESEAELESLVIRQLQPIPKVIEGRLLHTKKLATSMIDISDGLSSDLRHLCDASRTGAVIYSESVPVDPALTVFGPGFFGPEGGPRAFALHGGEDFELLFTSPPQNQGVLEGLGFVFVGEMTTDAGVILIEEDGRTSPLVPGGFTHF